jgi:sodium/hydrogen exchanger-like protein 3
MSAFVTIEIVTARDIIKGFLSFFLISGGGLAVGIIFGVLTAIITLHTTNVRG